MTGSCFWRRLSSRNRAWPSRSSRLLPPHSTHRHGRVREQLATPHTTHRQGRVREQLAPGREFGDGCYRVPVLGSGFLLGLGAGGDGKGLGDVAREHGDGPQARGEGDHL